jgi:hypothetical protein
MQKFRLHAVLVLMTVISTFAIADAQSDAQKLKDEAVDILKANAQRQASNEQYADCIFKLEKAQAILEKANDTESALAQEVSSSLFWARRFSNIAVINALEKLRAGGAAPPPVAKRTEPPKPVQKKAEDEPEDTNPELALAKKAFEAAQKFASTKSNDDYAVAMRWFQVAGEYSGTDYGLKALGLAREAQTRFSAKAAPAAAEALPDTPEMKLVIEADALAASGKFEQSFALYLSSLKVKETPIAHRKLGHAYFKRAQQLKDEFLPEFEAAEAERREAYRGAFTTVRTLGGSRRKFNPNHPPLVAAMRKQQDLVKKAYVSIAFYDKAHDEFKGVLRLAANGKDLDAAGHQALCLAVKGDPNVRARARQMLLSFLKDYSPANDLERSLYEFCKAELGRISGK